MKLFTAFNDQESTTSIELTQSNNGEDVDFYKEGKKLAQWLAWNTTKHFMNGLLSEYAEEYSTMVAMCDKEEFELDKDGFPVV